MRNSGGYFDKRFDIYFIPSADQDEDQFNQIRNRGSEIREGAILNPYMPSTPCYGKPRNDWIVTFGKEEFQDYILIENVPYALFTKELIYSFYNKAGFRDKSRDTVKVVKWVKPLKGELLSDYNGKTPDYYMYQSMDYDGWHYEVDNDGTEYVVHDYSLQWHYEDYDNDFHPTDDYYEFLSENGVSIEGLDISYSVCTFEVERFYASGQTNVSVKEVSQQYINQQKAGEYIQVITDAGTSGSDAWHEMISQAEKNQGYINQQLEFANSIATLTYTNSQSVNISPVITVAVTTPYKKDYIQPKVVSFTALTAPGAVGVVNGTFQIPPSGATVTGHDLMQVYKIPLTLHPTIKYTILIIPHGTTRANVYNAPRVSDAQITVYLPNYTE